MQILIGDRNTSYTIGYIGNSTKSFTVLYTEEIQPVEDIFVINPFDEDLNGLKDWIVDEMKKAKDEGTLYDYLLIHTDMTQEQLTVFIGDLEAVSSDFPTREILISCRG
ncbi:MAG: hypothetical protein J6O71_05560 [Lachnospiraceae bacterium]|nr:hypothetical protein [Lachnospiraceae bacterium]